MVGDGGVQPGIVPTDGNTLRLATAIHCCVNNVLPDVDGDHLIPSVEVYIDWFCPPTTHKESFHATEKPYRGNEPEQAYHFIPS